MSYALVLLLTLVLNAGLFGLGKSFKHTDTPGAAVMRGWMIFFLLAALAWFFKWPAMWVAPGLVIGLAVGGWTLVRRPVEGWLGALVIGPALIATLIALPFLLEKNLLAFSHWGTDLWGYVGVADWLKTHSVDELPVIGDRIGLTWVWHVLTVKDRPLLYEVLAMLSAGLGINTLLAYYVLAAGLLSALFTGLMLSGINAGLSWWPWKLCVCVIAVLQPLLLLHFQYQFMGGVVAALVFMLIVSALFQQQAERPAQPLFFAEAMLMSVLMGGLYTIKASLAALVMLLAVFAVSVLMRWKRKETLGWTMRMAWMAMLIMVAATAGFVRMKQLVNEDFNSVYLNGRVGHIWAHYAAIFGQTSITPWYQGDGAPGYEPELHLPAGSKSGIIWLGCALAFMLVQSWRWWREKRDATPIMVLGLIVGVMFMATPPRGNHWLMGRSLPIYGGAFLIAVLCVAQLRQHRVWALLSVILVCAPMVRGWVGLKPYLVKPHARLYDQPEKLPPDQDVWQVLGYVYFYEGKRPIDWTQLPNSFRAMTHYLPEEIRPKMPAKPE